MVKKYILLLLFTQLSTSFNAQVIDVLTREDFDLKGDVKSCLVLTDYGKEQLEFDEAGRVLKIVTQYNENDQDITLFKYENGKIIEKRLESYKNGEADLQTSMANFFEYDTIAEVKKITEKIISYDKAFFEAQEFFLDDKNRVERIVISHEDGVDEKRVAYETYKGEETTTVFLNDEVEKSTRISKKNSKKGEVTVKLVKEFMDGVPDKAVEQQYAATGELLSEQYFYYDEGQKQFASDQKKTMVYTDGVLTKEVMTKGNATSEKEFIFQFDDNEPKNWVKKITTPDNTYSTRRIIYFKKDEALAKTMN